MHAVDPTAILVQARVVRRVIRAKHELARYGVTVPHAESCTGNREQMRGVVHPDELGFSDESQIPELAILLAEPAEKELEELSVQELMLRTWRQLFHARVDCELQSQIDSQALTTPDIRRHIDAIGQVRFDEIHAVLQRENRLPNPDDRVAAFWEFVAMYSEFRWFAQGSVHTWFPSLDNLQRIDGILQPLVDGEHVFRSTRLYGAPEPDHALPVTFDDGSHSQLDRDELFASGEVSRRRFRRLMRRADKAGRRGNSVSAALYALDAASVAPADGIVDASTRALDEIHRLTDRLQVALDFDNEQAEDWRSALIGLLRRSASGFWNPDKRLLYDLQKVCVDHEREIYTVDLVKAIVSLGKLPIKRPLPNQREVMMSKHLASATARLVSVRLSGPDRERLAQLLRNAADSAERQMRGRLRPLLVDTLEQVDLEPNSVPERVAFNKLVDECLDCIALRGYLTMGHLRDAVSRNNLKLPDLTRFGELIHGDRLLRADDRFDENLDGVYHRGEFYLRWLQALSSVAFGTRTGRFFTQYMGIPYGGAYIALEGIRHVVDLVSGNGVDSGRLVSPVVVFLVGTFLLGLIHVAEFRTGVARLLRNVFRVVRFVAWEVPVRLYRLPWVRTVLRSAPVVALRHYVVFPGLLTAAVNVLCMHVLSSGTDAQPDVSGGGDSGGDGFFVRFSPIWQVAFFVGSAMALNSRFVRDAEELTLEWVSNRWHEILARVFVALFQWILESFKRLLNLLERLLYAVDEWLRFKSGETIVTLALKAVLGVVWSLIDFLVRVYVTLLIEPQVNPIKHFPVVTVSHKIILPITLWVQTEFGDSLAPFVGTGISNFVIFSTMFLLPGVFGFLVWELKENWRLYDANRSQGLPRVIIGSRGETLPRLLRPGFHSGTLPGLFRDLRRLETGASGFKQFRNRKLLYEQLHYHQVDIQRFIDRELLSLLRETPRWKLESTAVSSVRAASNSILVEIACGHYPGEDLQLAFQEQSGWLVASLAKRGWLDRLGRQDRDTFAMALTGTYRLGSVDLVREQIESAFDGTVPPYDITHTGLTVWPGGAWDVEITYDLHRDGVVRPSPTLAASRANLHPFDAREIRFSQGDILWTDWETIWDTASESTPPLPGARYLLPAIAGT